MMGYSTQSKGCKIWDIESSKLVVSRDLIFDESSVNPPQVHIQPNEVTDSNLVDTGRGRIKTCTITSSCLRIRRKNPLIP